MRPAHPVRSAPGALSRGAGLPDWATLLERLGARAGIDDREGFARLDHLDRAEVLERRFGGTAALGVFVISLIFAADNSGDIPDPNEDVSRVPVGVFPLRVPLFGW